MSTVTIEVLPPNTVYASERVARGLGAFLFVSSVLFVLFAGTFPFDFRVPRDGIVQQIRSTFDWRFNPYDPGHVDRRQNIEFFLPFGFAIASIVWPSQRRRSRRALAQIMVAMVSGAALSSFVEACQAFVSFRDPSFADVWCNTVGSIFGAAAYAAFGDPILRAAAKGLLRLRPLAKPAVLGSALVAYAALQLAAPLLVRNAGDLSVWDPAASLVVGNSIAGEAAWNGSVSDIVLADRAIDADQAMELARGAEPLDVLNSALLAHYHLAGPPPYREVTGHIRSSLDWTTLSGLLLIPLPNPSSSESPSFSQDRWLRTDGGFAPAVFPIQESSEFTLATTACSFSPDQRRADAAPLTFLTLASHPRSMNVVVGQDQQDLMVRVRTAIRGMPGLYVRDVFRDTSFHHIAVTAKQAQIIVYVDGTERGRCEITPEAKGIWRLYPRVGFRLWLDRYGFRSYAAIYRLLVFIPFAALLGATLAMSDLRIHARRIVGVGATLVMALLLEVILGSESASGFQVKNLIISLLIGLGALGALAWLKRRDGPEQRRRRNERVG